MTWERVLLGFLSGCALITLAFARQYGYDILSIDFYSNFSFSTLKLSEFNSGILFAGGITLFLFVFLPLIVTRGSTDDMLEEWSRRTSLPPDMNPLEFFIIRKRK